MRIERKNTLALIIDIQEKLFPHIHEKELLSGNVLTLIRGLRILDVPQILTEQYPKGLGPTLAEVREALGDCQPQEKTAFSCCDDPALMTRLEHAGRKFILLAGIETHVCILQTALDLTEMGMIPVVVEDCVSSRKIADKQTAIRRLTQEGAMITSVESILFELTRFSGTDEFRAISKLVK